MNSIGQAHSGAPSTALLCIELCAGCAQLSAVMHNAGFKVVAVNHSKNRHKQLHPCINVDLASDEGLKYILGLLSQPGTVLYVHATPPWGTSCRARDRRVSKWMRANKCPDPPLRSESFPHGLPNLTQLNQKRIDTANSIFANINKIMRKAVGMGCIISILNPRRSYLWLTSWMQQLIAECELFHFSFQQCMYGGARDQWCTIYTNCREFAVMTKECDQSHPHEPWGAAKLRNHMQLAPHEAECPLPLCVAIRDIVLAVAQQRGVQFLQAPRTKKQKLLTTAIRSAEAGRQPRGNKLPQIVSEYKTTVIKPWPFSYLPPFKRTLTSAECHVLKVPAGSKLLRQTGEKLGRADDAAVEVQVGIFRSPEEFVKECLTLQHPFDGSESLEDDLKHNIFHLLTLGPERILQIRSEMFAHYENVKAELHSEESRLHQAMDPEREKLIANKCVLLFERMARDAGVDDDGLAALLYHGISLVGQGGPTGQFPEESVPPAMTADQLMRSAKWSRHMVLGKKSAVQASHIREAVWKGTMEDVDRGWLTGPVTHEELVGKFGPLYVVSRRFGLEQADKVRPIDDLSESLVNAAFGTSYKLELPGIDGVAVLSRTMLESVSSTGVVKIKLSTGKFLKGLLHPSLTVEQSRTLVGRTLDLDSAYKQVLVSLDTMWTSVLAVEDTAGEKQLFYSNVLPFGGSAAVYGFNRLSRAIFTIGVRLFDLIWQNYYDDYPQLDLACNGNSAQHSAEQLFTLLGWSFSMKPSKRRNMSTQFDVLGVTFDFSCSREGTVSVRNKVQRIEQILTEVSDILAASTLSSSRAASLRGKLQFMESQVFGRMLSANLRVFQSRALGALAGSHLSQELRSELEWIAEFVKLDEPRTLKAGMGQDRLVIFTDAALEQEDTFASIGMVAYRMSGSNCIGRFFFSEQVPPYFLSAAQNRSMKVISTLELAAAVAGVMVLSKLVSSLRVFLFCDNEAARASLISMYSPIVSHNRLLQLLNREILRHSLYVWTARVPSASNIADAVSRLNEEHVLKENFRKESVPWDELLAAL